MIIGEYRGYIYIKKKGSEGQRKIFKYQRGLDIVPSGLHKIGI